MSHFKADWNGNRGMPFSREAINLFMNIIKNLKVQPEIAPTGRNSLYMQYILGTDILAYEIQTNTIEEVFVPGGDYSKAESKTFNSRLVDTLFDRVENVYGIK